MVRIALFASGNGSNAENVYLSLKDRKDIIFTKIYCNKPDAFVIERAKKLKINSFIFNKTDLENPSIVLKTLQEDQTDLIVLCGFLLKIPECIVDSFKDRILNIHPALLPKYGGKGMYGMNVHNAVKANKETKSGITIHLVNKHYDEGSILFQAECEILTEDTAEDIANKVHKLEYENYPEIVGNYIDKIR